MKSSPVGLEENDNSFIFYFVLMKRKIMNVPSSSSLCLRYCSPNLRFHPFVSPFFKFLAYNSCDIHTKTINLLKLT